MFILELCSRVKCENGARCVAGVCVCPEICPEDKGNAVCGSDTKTYESECELQRVACDRDPKLPPLHVIFYGDCGERSALAALSEFAKFEGRFFKCTFIMHHFNDIILCFFLFVAHAHVSILGCIDLLYSASTESRLRDSNN